LPAVRRWGFAGQERPIEDGGPSLTIVAGALR
jgi:hypothetical protein